MASRFHLFSCSFVLIVVAHLCMLSLTFASSSSSSSSSTVTSTTVTSSGGGKSKEKETTTIKNKLATAEGRVSDLISRLDTVSTDATRAKSEIHNTLMEVWKVVDMLGKDRCGSVVETVRTSLKTSEAKITTLENDIRTLTKEREDQQINLAKLESVETGLLAEVKAERSRRETLELEIRELRDKLHWANIMSNETKVYDIVSERLQNLLVVVNERTAILNRITTMFSDAHQGFGDWQNEIMSLSTLVRDSERQFIGEFQDVTVDTLKRQIKDLENRLVNAETAREDVRRQRDDARNQLNIVSKQQQQQQQHQQQQMHQQNYRTTISTSSSSGGSAGMSSGGYSREAVTRRTTYETSNGWFGWLTFVILSGGTGMIFAYLVLLPNRNNGMGVQFPLQQQHSTNQQHPAEQLEPTSFGFTPSSSPGRLSRTPPSSAGGSVPPGTSPLTFVERGSGSRTPGSRNSTPRRY